MEDLRKYTRRTELYKLSAEEQTEKMKLVMKEVEKISAYTGVSEEAAYDLFLNGYDVPSELDGQKIAFSESELTPDLLTNLAENNVRTGNKLCKTIANDCFCTLLPHSEARIAVL